MLMLPLTSDGERLFTVTLEGVTYNFRVYYVLGQGKYWLMDIRDANNAPLASGIKLVPGCINSLKGYGNTFADTNAIVYLSEGSPGAEDAPGLTLYVLWFPPGDTDYIFTNGDPMDNVGATFGLVWGG